MNVIADAGDAADLAPIRTRRTGPVLAVASAAALVLVIGLWWVKRQPAPSAVTPPVVATRAAPEPIRPPEPARSAEVTPPPQPAQPAVAARPEEAARPAKTVAAAPAAASRPASDKVKLVISSAPSGADVCFASDRVLLGKTRLDVATKKNAGAAKLLIRKAGYRGQEISIVADHDIKKSIKLEPLGPDDMASTENCGF